MNDLPAGWRRAPLAELAEIQGGIQKQPKRAPRSNRFPFLRVANVTAAGLDVREVHEIELFGDELQRLRLASGDLLVVEGNGSASQIGRAAVWDGSIPDCVHQNHLIRVRPGSNLLPKYLGLVWNSPAIRDELTAVSSSTSGLHTLSVAKLKRIKLPLPPVDEQGHIVEILEDHLSRLAAAENYLAAGRARADPLAESQLDAELAHFAPSTSPLGDLLEAPLANGRSVPTADVGFPVLRLTCLKGNSVDLSARKIGAWLAADAEPFIVRRGDFFVSRGNGTLRLVGRGGLVSEEPDPVAFPDTLIRVRPRADVLDAKFLSVIWNSRTVRRQIEAAARTTAGIHKVSQKDLQRVLVPVPSIPAQQIIVSRTARMVDSVNHVVTDLTAAEMRASTLRRALLSAAFAGHLTAQTRHVSTESLEPIHV